MSEKLLRGIAVFCGTAWLLATPLLAAPQFSNPGLRITGNTPAFAGHASLAGAANPAEMIDVSIWLKPRNRTELDQLARDLYDENSPQFHRWLTKAEFTARFAPSAAQAEMVRSFFRAHGLAVVSTGPDNMFVRAHGSIANVQNTFSVKLNRYVVGGRTVRANETDPYVAGPAGALVQSVAGLNDLGYSHPFAQRFLRSHNQAKALNRSMAAQDTGAFFTSACFTGPETETFVNNGTVAIYKGNGYISDPATPGCGYAPQDIWKAYNLKGLYEAGYDGTGQTIVIIDWCGSPTIMQDANAFSARYNLPPLTPFNFSIINYPTPSTCSAVDPEINIDVEWAHAIAPGANIALVVPPTASFQDVNQAQYFAENYGLGNVISGSYGSEELKTPRSVLANENLLNEIAAVLGISANFSTGDDGDFSGGTGAATSVSAPADSPYATGVGGVSLALKRDGTINFQTGWGTNQTLLYDQGLIFNPPINGGFVFGSGGGASAVFAKPGFQSGLAGNARKLPDIAWLGDPFTGGVIAITEPGLFPAPTWQAYGGTSLACPMFSALWAIANQESGTPLGQAARYLYRMPKSTITDIVPVSSKTNVFGVIFNLAQGMTTFSPAQLAAPLEATTQFYSALWTPQYSGETLVLTFGTDTGLVVKPGWDNVTGLGTPNGKAFADYFNPAITKP